MLVDPTDFLSLRFTFKKIIPCHPNPIDYTYTYFEILTHFFENAI